MIRWGRLLALWRAYDTAFPASQQIWSQVFSHPSACTRWRRGITRSFLPRIRGRRHDTKAPESYDSSCEHKTPARSAAPCLLQAPDGNCRTRFSSPGHHTPWTQMTNVEPKPTEPPANDGSPPPEGAGDAEFVLSGCMTLADALAAHRLAARGYWLRRTVRLLALASFLGIWITIAVSARYISPETSNEMLLGACVLFPAVLFAIHTVGRVRLRRMARKQLGQFAPTHSTFSRSKIVLTPENARLELQWGTFDRCFSNETVAILYFKNTKIFLIIPRQKLADPSQWDPFISMIRTQLRRTGNSPR